MNPTPPLKTALLPADAIGVAQAVAVLRAGGLVALPTETVYGLGADARDDLAVARIFAAKGRPRFNPLIVHVHSLQAAHSYGLFGDEDLALARAFWPGPLTLVVPQRRGAGLSELVTAGLDTVAIRVPGSALARQVLAAFDGPVAAPSANPSGRISPTRAAHVLDGLDGLIDAVLDGGEAQVGVESTIVGGGVLLRPGGIPAEAMAVVFGRALATREADSAISAPGQLLSHYAPRASVRLNAVAPLPGEVWLGFGPECPQATRNLSPTGDLTEAAAQLFHAMRALDAMARPIAVAPIPDRGLGRAINDRLQRAAADRD